MCHSKDGGYTAEKKSPGNMGQQKPHTGIVQDWKSSEEIDLTKI